MPATLSGTVFLDYNANGNFEILPPVTNNSGAGTTTLAAEIGWSGLAQPWDPLSSRVPVTVRAFDSNNALAASTTSNINGTYTLTVSNTGGYRLEFSNLPNQTSFGPSGINNGTAVQFANVPSASANISNLNLGIVKYEDITPNSPALVTNTFVFGAFDNPETKNAKVIRSYPYVAGASIPVPDNPFSGPGFGGPYTQPSDHPVRVTHGEVGATWGLAYDRLANKLYASAFTKQHSGYGPSGPGAIYVMDGSPVNRNVVTTADTLVDLEALAPGSTGRNYRTEAAWSDPANNPVGDDDYIHDGTYIDELSGYRAQVGWDAVGKSGLGGLDVDASGRYLFTVALGDRRLYIIDTQNPSAAPVAISLPILTGETGYTGTSANNPYGDLRPFAVSYFKGSVYVGAVNTAESTTLGGTVVGNRDALRAYVFQFKLNTDANGEATGGGTFIDLNSIPTTSAAVLNVPLNYTRGFIHPGPSTNGGPPEAVSANWLPWTPVYRNIAPAGLPDLGMYPQPWLTGLAFDENGDIVLAFRDRSGDQFGLQTPKNPADPMKLFIGIAAGDMLRGFLHQQSSAGNITSRWTMESNGQGPGGIPASEDGVGNNQGPGGGEFYSGDFMVPGIYESLGIQDHQEVSVGGVIQLPGHRDIATTSIFASLTPNRNNTGGIRWYQNSADATTSRAGDLVRAYELYQTVVYANQVPPSFSKAFGIADIVAMRTTPIEIGNRVFIDLDRNGIQDVSEPGVQILEVVLYRDGVPLATTTTDLDGNYYFTSLADPGVPRRLAGKTYGVDINPNTAYEIRIPQNQPQLLALSLTTTNANLNTRDTIDSDAIAVGGDAVISLTTGRPGQNVHTYDAGFVYQLSIGDHVWNDENNDGIRQASELPIGGVLVELLDQADNVISSRSTNPDGGYIFSNLNPGQYRVRIPLTNNPRLQGMYSSSGTNGSQTGAFEPENRTLPLQGNNRDNGVTVGTNVVSALINLQPGSAPLRELDAPQGTLNLIDTAGDVNSQREIDFGFYLPVTIGDRVFIDNNNNGIRETSERDLAGVTVQLFNLDSGTPTLVTSGITNASGGYLFTFLRPGAYQVRLLRNDALAGYVSSTGTPGSPTGPFQPVVGDPADDRDHGTEDTNSINGPVIQARLGLATVADPANFPAGLPADPAQPTSSFRNQDFGVFQPVELGNFVFEDFNNNGIFDGTDRGVAGILVELLDANGNPMVVNGNPVRTTTNADGNYLFTNLIAGQYRIRITAPAGYSSSTGANGSTGPFEPGLPGSDLTNNADHGTGAAGTQLISASTVTLGIAGTTNPDSSTSGVANAANLRQDFGIYRRVSLGDYVWDDFNNNGRFDAGESPLAAVLVRLLDANGNPLIGANGNPITTTTAADGGYLFSNLNAGQYQVEVVIPQGYISSTGTVGNPAGPFEPVNGNPPNNQDHGTTNPGGVVRGPVRNLQPGQAPLDDTAGPNSVTLADLVPNESSYRDQDFGFFRPLSVGDYVWLDVNNNGLADPGEPGIAGVTVYLIDGSGATISTATTSGDGLYRFSGLSAGTYSVEIVPPAGLRSSTGGAGSAYEPAAQSDINNADKGTTQATGRIRTASFTLNPASNPDENGTANLRQDFGLYRTYQVGDFVWNDVNNNGQFDTGETPVTSVPVRLLNASGAVVASTTTDANGLYLFSELLPGTYSVEITAPTGYRSSTGGVGSAFEPAPQNNTNNVDKGTTQGSVIRTQPFDLLVDGNPDSGGLANLRQDFGLYRTYSVGDFVWNDANNNGQFDAGEAPMTNVPVRLLDASGNLVASTTTDANGLYLFTELLPSMYAVEITAPTGFRSSTGGTSSAFEPAPQNNTNNIDKGTEQGSVIRAGTFDLLTNGNPDLGGLANLRQDFGLYQPASPPPPAVPPAAVSGYVYVDSNINGVRDPGERPIPGTRVYLDGTDDQGNVIAVSTLTDTNGFYEFTNLRAGNYTVREQQPEGTFYDGFDTAGTISGTVVGTAANDIIRSIRLSPGDLGVNYNFGEIPNAATFGYVWYDLNENGIFEDGEEPIPGVSVTISGTAFAGTSLTRPLTSADVPGGLTVITNSQGRYDFPSLPYGEYTLTETQPVDFDDWMEQDGDPNGPRPTMANDVFSGITLSFATPIRGPFNFGETLSSSSRRPPQSPQLPGNQSPTKRQFLASTEENGSITRRSANAPLLVQPAVGVVAPVANVDLQPSFPNTGLSPNRPTYIATGAGEGAAPLVRVFDYASGIERFRFLAYEQGYTGGVRTATGDLNGDGIPDIVTTTGVGGGPRIRAFNGVDGSLIHDFFAYEATYTGGMSVAIADINGDGIGDIVTGTDRGGGPRVRVLSGLDTSVISDFFAFDPNQRGGVRVAAADFNSDARADIVAATGAGVPTMVRVYNMTNMAVLQEISPYTSSYTGGVYVSTGDFNADGTPDIITGTDVGGGSQVNVFDGRTGLNSTAFFAFESSFTGGVRVSSVDLDRDGRTEIIAAAGHGGGARVVIYSGANLQVIDDFFAFDATMRGGVFLGASAATRKLAPASGNPVDAGFLGKPGSLPGL
ncbi:MAG: SdrD B-like domain-containing protein [Fimbriiglobus sp.]